MDCCDNIECMCGKIEDQVESPNSISVEWKEEESDIIKHAKRELELSGYDLNQTEEDPNKWMVENVLELLRVFDKQGHSGFQDHIVSIILKN